MENTERFSNRVQDYVKYRPHYPKQLIQRLQKDYGITTKDRVVDIGSGTGISCLPFLENGNTVLGVEPNTEMRLASETFLESYPNFQSINGTAEQTGLADNSVDIIFAAQAFHWFDRELAKQEFFRILKPDGHIFLIWNQRIHSSPFLQGYEQLLKDHIAEYAQIMHRSIPEDEIRDFLSPKPIGVFRLYNFQEFDWTGFKGRVLSSSYVPKEGDIHDIIMQGIEQLFEQYAENNKVKFEYDTMIYGC